MTSDIWPKSVAIAFLVSLVASNLELGVRSLDYYDVTNDLRNFSSVFCIENSGPKARLFRVE